MKVGWRNKGCFESSKSIHGQSNLQHRTIQNQRAGKHFQKTHEQKSIRYQSRHSTFSTERKRTTQDKVVAVFFMYLVVSSEILHFINMKNAMRNSSSKAHENREVTRSNNKSSYKFLNVSRQADEVEVRKAYHRCVYKFHPDRNNGSVTEFYQCSDAYQKILKQCSTPFEGTQNEESQSYCYSLKPLISSSNQSTVTIQESSSLSIVSNEYKNYQLEVVENLQEFELIMARSPAITIKYSQRVNKFADLLMKYGARVESGTECRYENKEERLCGCLDYHYTELDMSTTLEFIKTFKIRRQSLLKNIATFFAKQNAHETAKRFSEFGIEKSADRIEVLMTIPEDYRQANFEHFELNATDLEKLISLSLPPHITIGEYREWEVHIAANHRAEGMSFHSGFKNVIGLLRQTRSAYENLIGPLHSAYVVDAIWTFGVILGSQASEIVNRQAHYARARLQSLRPKEGLALPMAMKRHGMLLSIYCNRIDQNGKKIFELTHHETARLCHKQGNCYSEMREDGKWRYQTGRIFSGISEDDLYGPNACFLENMFYLRMDTASTFTELGKKIDDYLLRLPNVVLQPPSLDGRLWSKGQWGGSCSTSPLLSFLRSQMTRSDYKYFVGDARITMLQKWFNHFDYTSVPIIDLMDRVERQFMKRGEIMPDNIQEIKNGLEKFQNYSVSVSSIASNGLAEASLPRKIMSLFEKKECNDDLIKVYSLVNQMCEKVLEGNNTGKMFSDETGEYALLMENLYSKYFNENGSLKDSYGHSLRQIYFLAAISSKLSTTFLRLNSENVFNNEVTGKIKIFRRVFLGTIRQLGIDKYPFAQLPQLQEMNSELRLELEKYSKEEEKFYQQ